VMTLGAIYLASGVTGSLARTGAELSSGTHRPAELLGHSHETFTIKEAP